MAYIVGLEAIRPMRIDLARSIDTVVQSFQPSPVLTHVESCFRSGRASPDVAQCGSAHELCNVLGTQGWGTTFENAEDFTRKELTRGEPTPGRDAPQRLRSVCESRMSKRVRGVVWLYNYPFGRCPIVCVGARGRAEDACSLRRPDGALHTACPARVGIAEFFGLVRTEHAVLEMGQGAHAGLPETAERHGSASLGIGDCCERGG